ncbi:MAG: histidine kinase, partial [Pedobacter sp.]
HNAVKYADAQLIKITLQQQTSKLVLTIDDDGKGFVMKTTSTDEKPLRAINGLNNMHTRTRLLNGVLTITSKPKKGTKVRVSVNL